MRYLSQYTEEATTKALRKAGAFFAFSDKQFEEQAGGRDMKDYCNMGMGLICPKDTAKELAKDLDETIQAGIKQDIEENGPEAIIRRELYNHEAFYTGDIESTAEKLAGYNIERSKILEIFNEERNDKNREKILV